MARREKQWRRILSTSLLDATVPSDEVSSKSDCENRANRKLNRLLETGLVVLGLATSHCRNEMKIAGTSMSVPIDITDDTLASSLVPVQCASLAPPA